MTELERAILAYLLAQPFMPLRRLKEISAAVGVHEEACKAALMDLEERGHVTIPYWTATVSPIVRQGAA